MIKSLVALLVTVTRLSVAMSAPPAEDDFDAFQTWLASLTADERREHFASKSEAFIAEHGEEADQIRLCVSLDQDWMGIDLWVD